jgi:hypothetical protein
VKELTMTLRVLLALPLLAACAAVVEPEPVPADYTDWFSIISTGPAPGHGDSDRVIYVNDVARGWAGAGEYAVGSIIVKEIRDPTPDGTGDGAVRYLGVMRRLARDQVPAGGELDGGWLFTYLADDIDSPEEYRPGCWDGCHVAAPYHGTFLRYGYQ